MRRFSAMNTAMTAAACHAADRSACANMHIALILDAILLASILVKLYMFAYNRSCVAEPAGPDLPALDSGISAGSAGLAYNTLPSERHYLRVTSSRIRRRGAPSFGRGPSLFV